MYLQNALRRVWQRLAWAAPERGTLRRQPGGTAWRPGVDMGKGKLRASRSNLTVKTTDPLVRLLALASRRLLL